MSDSRGYSYALVTAINAADPKLLGVRLGRVCVKQNISVTQVAKDLGVSRQTVYWWFTGVFKPQLRFADKVLQMIEAHTKDRV